jgi:RNA polymerase sigma factor (sigma-70 family)
MSATLESQWSVLFAQGNSGDAQAYREFLESITPYLRGLVRRKCSLLGAESDAEDIVQEILLVIHLKRATWDSKRPVGPWISTIARNKFIDSMRRRGRHVSIPLEDVIESLPAQQDQDDANGQTVSYLLEKLKSPQRDIVQLISLEGGSVRDTAEQLGMSEGAVRVSLHRALKVLAAIYKGSSK